jgi:hypothetical protein
MKMKANVMLEITLCVDLRAVFASVRVSSGLSRFHRPCERFSSLRFKNEQTKSSAKNPLKGNEVLDGVYIVAEATTHKDFQRGTFPHRDRPRRHQVKNLEVPQRCCRRMKTSLVVRIGT